MFLVYVFRNANRGFGSSIFIRDRLFQWFMAWRGYPSKLSTQIMERTCIENWNQSHIANDLNQKGITWVFNPPTSSHIEGVWENLVRRYKRIFRAELKNKALTDEVLATVMTEVKSSKFFAGNF